MREQGNLGRKHPPSKNLGGIGGMEVVMGTGIWILLTLLKVIFTSIPLTSKSPTTIYTFYGVQKTVELIYCESGLLKHYMRSKLLNGQ